MAAPPHSICRPLFYGAPTVLNLNQIESRKSNVDSYKQGTEYRDWMRLPTARRRAHTPDPSWRMYRSMWRREVDVWKMCVRADLNIELDPGRWVSDNSPREPRAYSAWRPPRTQWPQ